MFFSFCYKSKKLECQEECQEEIFLKKIIKMKEQEEMVNVDDDKENFKKKYFL